jgi:hypothetical protein
MTVVWMGVQVASPPSSNGADSGSAELPNPEYSGDDLGVRELVLRRLLGSANEGTLCFLSFGTCGKTWISPPQGFVDRFSDLPVRFRPVSEARIPLEREKDSNGLFRSVEDRRTGKSGKVYYVQILRWHGEHKVEVSAGVYGGSLDGFGARYIVEKQNGKWIISKQTHKWVS